MIDLMRVFFLVQIFDVCFLNWLLSEETTVTQTFYQCMFAYRSNISSSAAHCSGIRLQGTVHIW